MTRGVVRLFASCVLVVAIGVAAFGPGDGEDDAVRISSCPSSWVQRVSAT